MNNQTIDVIQKRDIDKILFSITVLSQQVFYNDGTGYIYKRNINIFIGCNINGVRKHITTIFEDDFEKVSDWYNLFLKFKNKGVIQCFFLVSNNENIIKAFKLAFSGGETFHCFFDDIYRLQHYITFSYANDILGKCRKVCLSETIDEFDLRKNELLEEYSSHPFIKDILIKSFDKYNKCFKYSYYLRKHLLSYYFLRDFKKKMMVISNSKPYFSNVNEFTELLLPTIQRYESKMYCSKENWNQIISYLYENNKELLSGEL